MTAPTPALRRSVAEQRKLEAALTELFERLLSFNQILGLKVLRLGPGGPQLRFDMRPELVGHYQHGRLHGGVISAVLDVAGGFAIMLSIAGDAEITAAKFPNMGTIDLRVDYLRPGRGKHFIATARIVRRGSRIAVTHMELHNDTGELIATGGAAYVIG